jgi:hypothetical protein
MKYTHLDIVNSINDRKEGKNTLSWIEKYGIYLCNTSKNIAGSVLVLSIENDDNLSVYDCYFKSKGERTKFCVNKAISSVPFAEISSLLKNVKCFESNTQQYWNECFCKGQFDQMVTDKKDTLQRPETKASSDPSVNLTMSDFLSDLEKLVKEAIKEIAKTANDWNKYDKIYIASADGRNTYPLVLPLKYTLYNLFKTDSKKIWGETFRVKDKEGKNIKKPLSSYNYDWKACQQYFHIGALSRAIGLNVSLELTMNDLMKADGIRVTFPLETGDDGSYTLPATPVLKECSSDNNTNTKKISLGGVELNWADLYENVQWDYKVGNHAFKHIKLSICADGCQRLYLMDGEKVLTVITSNGSTVEVDTSRREPIAEPATIVEEPEIDVIDQTVSEPADNPTNVVVESENPEAKPIDSLPIGESNPEDTLAIKRVVSKNVQWGLDLVIECIREATVNFLKQEFPDDWEVKKKKIFTTPTLKNIDYGNYHGFVTEYKNELIKFWGEKRYYTIKNNMYDLTPFRNDKSHELDKVIARGKMEVSALMQKMRVILNALNSSNVEEIDNAYKEIDRGWKI